MLFELFHLLPVARKIKSLFHGLQRIISLTPLSIGESYHPDMDRKVRELLMQESYDVVQIEFIWMAQYLISNNAIIKNARTILVEHDVANVSCYRDMLTKSGLERLLSYLEYLKMKRYEKHAVKAFNRIVVMSNIDKERLLELSPTIDVEVIPNGVDTHYLGFHVERRIEKNQLIYVGWMRHFPNIDAVFYFVRSLANTRCSYLGIASNSRDSWKKDSRGGYLQPVIYL